MESANSVNQKARIVVSRNSPIALVVGVAGFLGSHVADKLLKKNIQVIGIDDFSLGEKRNLEDATKDNHFHLINESINRAEVIEHQILNNLPRLDYAFFVADSADPSALYSTGLLNFLKLLKRLKNEDEFKNIKIVFTSSIELYGGKLEQKAKYLKQAEILFAKFVKDKNLNGRVVRLASLYGPRMRFESEDDPVATLIRASISGEVHLENIDSEYITRNLYVEDAVSLVLKTVLSGGTANKIFDGALIHPIKVSEIKEVLLDPLWFESKGFKQTELPPWPTPNLNKTIRELSWRPKTQLINSLRETVAYFKDRGMEFSKKSEEKTSELGSRWSFKSMEEGTEVRGQGSELKRRGEEEVEVKEERKRGGIFNKDRGVFILITLLVVFALVYPLINLAIGAFSVRHHLRQSAVYLQSGDFERSNREISLAEEGLKASNDTLNSLAIIKRMGILSGEVEKVEKLLELADEGVEGVKFAISGSESLFKTTKVISGEDKADPKPMYEKAQVDLTAATTKLSKVSSNFSNKDFQDQYPSFLKHRIVDMSEKLNFYRDVVEQAKSASFLMPELTAVNGKKSYLVLLQNNLELRPTGGFIGSYAKINFEGGKLTNIHVDDIYNLDGGLRDIIEPPAELKSDLGITRWFLRDSNFDPDYPTSARQAEFFYRKESGETVQGVIALDLSGSSKLLTAVKGLNLAEYGDSVDSSNLFEKVVSHAEVSFFPGSQAKKNYLVSLQAQLFNKVFYLSNQNWPAIVQAISDSLKEKHLLIYLDDPTLFSYLTSANWAGVFPRAAQAEEGETNDFLGVVEANMGANKSNFFLQRNYKLETTFGKEGQISQKLTINYKNNSPSEVFPAGKYKNRLRVYLPLGSKLTKALLGETEITNKFNSFTDYGRAGYSALVEIAPQEQKSLVLFYEEKPIIFLNQESNYRLEVFKQPGTDKDPFLWEVNYPINFEVSGETLGAEVRDQQIKVNKSMQTDLIFLLNIRQK